MVGRAVAALRSSPVVAAILSFLLPGAGHAWVGAYDRALIFVAPLVLLAIGGGLVMATQGTARTLGLALQPNVLLGFVAGNLAIAAWRVAATVDAFQLARARWPSAGAPWQRTVAVGVVAVLLVLTMGTHAGLGYVGYQTYKTVTTVFATPTPVPTPTPEPAPTGPTPTPRPPWSPTPTPVPTPPPIWSTDGRLDILLMGVDEGPGRLSLRPDALILLSVDVASGKAALFGIPRYLQNVPLPPRSVNAFACRCFPGYLNALYRYAEDNPVWFAGPDGIRGLEATEEAIGAMVGLHLDGWLLINFQGFMRMIDALGGITIYVPDALYDPRYPKPDGTGNIESPSRRARNGWMGSVPWPTPGPDTRTRTTIGCGARSGSSWPSDAR